MLEDPYRPEFMTEVETLKTGELSVSQGSSAWMVGAVTVCRDAIGGPVAGVRRFGSSFSAVDIVVGPVGGDRSNCLVDCGPWF